MSAYYLRCFCWPHRFAWLRVQRAVFKSQKLKARPLSKPRGGARSILSCAPGACDEVPRGERGAWLRGAAPGSATTA
jgi:hypothetical protein